MVGLPRGRWFDSPAADRSVYFSVAAFVPRPAGGIAIGQAIVPGRLPTSPFRTLPRSSSLNAAIF